MSSAPQPQQPETRAFAPHCDQQILHSPGQCEYCDQYSDWQEARIVQGINFSDTDDPDKAPCPSLRRRSADKRDRWGGNRAKPSEARVWREFQEVTTEMAAGELELDDEV